MRRFIHISIHGFVAALLAFGGVAIAKDTPPSTSPDQQGQNMTSTTAPTTAPVKRSDSFVDKPATAPADNPPSNPQVSGIAVGPAKQLGKVVVSSDFDEARARIAPSLGADAYTIGPDQIQNIPGGSNASFQQVLIRAPGVVQDSFGQEHVRGEHANLTYRINGVLLPQPLNGFGQELDTRLIRSLTLVTGSLPAQFGFHTAGIVDVTTKSGDTLNGNEFSLYGGSNHTIQPAVQFGGTNGKLDYFFTGSFNHNGLGLENPTSTHRALHDNTDQERFFGYMSYRIDDTSRLSFFANASNADFQIPNTKGIPGAFDFRGQTTTRSENLNENQNEQEYYSVIAYQKSIGQASFQLSGFSRYGQIRYRPDPAKDLILQGVSGEVYNNFLTNGLQFDSSYVISNQHTLRAGFIADYTTERLDTNTAVFNIDNTGAQTSNTPFTIRDNSGNVAWESGIYVQDEWRITPKLTLNYGLRYDRFDSSFDNEDQVSPRLNAVYKIDDATTIHGGYSRYFVTPPVQNVSQRTISKFVGSTNAPSSLVADRGKSERSNYYDLGISRQMNKSWQVNLDGFYKDAKNLIDLGQFGAPVILAPFNYKHGTVYGAELSSTYKVGGFSAFGNLSWSKTMAHDINSQQYLIDPDELAFIKNHNIHLDHDNEFAVSAGASYAWRNNLVYVDLLYGSGLRGGFANTHQLQQHYPVNLGYQHIFHLDGAHGKALRFRVDLINVFDQKYKIRDGSGIGVGAAQFGQRRAILAGLTYAF